MQKAHVEHELREAHEALGQILNALRTDPDYEIANYRVDMQHLYHHINTAWNAKDVPDESVYACSEKDFALWSRYPADLEPLGS